MQHRMIAYRPFYAYEASAGIVTFYSYKGERRESAASVSESRWSRTEVKRSSVDLTPVRGATQV